MQLGFMDIDTFETPKLPNALFCHQEFLERLAEHGRDAIGRRAAFLMQRLSVDARRLHYKPTLGPNRGWRRSRLGGNHGSHFYAWWAPKNAIPLKESGDFSDVPDGAVFLRDIRHHDDHALLPAHSFSSYYMPVTVRDLRREEYAPLPWTPPQVRFASGRQSVRLLKGHPGSGKTTALWNAADATGADRVLYVTYSSDLASLAREYFDRFCSSHKRFDVITFPNLVRQLLGIDAAVQTEREVRKQFRRDVAPFARLLGPWANNQTALYDELHAHLAGDALPLAIGRFAFSKKPRVGDGAYRERRTRFLGQSAVSSALDVASRLEGANRTTLAETYFPEIAFAWRAVEKLRTPDFSTSFDYGCIAVDECQDLTPIEALVIVEFAARINRGRRVAIPVLVAGDEAQTVRPTDFEWGWFCDILHSEVGTPTEYKLASNLRSPHRIAELVNRVWDLYSHIQKHDRPSGANYAEIEDDTSGQILYCTATPGAELDELFTSLAAREGLALITLEEDVPAYVPEVARSAVLTVSEAKGLDFHSVCILDAGRHVTHIVGSEGRLRSGYELDSLRRRLAIDQLRVAISRPTERLLWLDVNPTDQIVRQSIAFLNGNDGLSGVSSCVPAALLKTLGEDELDPEERVQRCQADARQYLQVKPEIAWSRAQQAINLLGRPGSLTAITDEAARNAAYLTLAEVCFTLGVRNAQLPAELGGPNLFQEAQRAAAMAHRYGLADILEAVGQVHRAPLDRRPTALGRLAHLLPEHKSEIEPWLRVELATRSAAWVDMLESALFSGHNAGILIKLLPPFYEVLDIADREARTADLRQRAILLLIKDKQFAPALDVLQSLPKRQPKLEAVCHEGLGDFRNAAECHMLAGNLKEAVAAYRSIPDFEAALNLVRQIGDHPAAESLEWLAKMQQVIGERPDKFNRIVTTPEKKLLEDMLEKALGVTRKKAAPRKAAGTKTAGAKPAARKKTVPTKRAPLE